MARIHIETEQLLTPFQAAVALNTTDRTLWNWRKAGTGPRWVDLGPRCIRYRIEDIQAWKSQSV